MAEVKTEIANACKSPNHEGIRLSLCEQFSGLNHEIFVVVFLDARSAVMRSEVMFQGDSNTVMVNCSAVARAAMLCGAASIVVSHNHTTSSAKPSALDVRLTRRLSLVMAIAGIPLLDHIIVAAGEIHSMADRGSWTAPLEEFAELMGEYGVLHTSSEGGS